MAVVKGLKEKVHLPLYDSIFVRPDQQLSKTLTSNVLRFFQEVTGKNKLQTNMQAASLLPHWNTYEARALRVVISDLVRQFSFSDETKVDIEGVNVIDGKKSPDAVVPNVILKGFNPNNFLDLKRQLEIQSFEPVMLTLQELVSLNFTTDPQLIEGEVAITRSVLNKAEAALNNLLISKENGRTLPPTEQIVTDEDFSSVISKFIYNTVTTFFVGEKIMIQVPTWFFPAGGGPFSQNSTVTTHGYPSPEATFRFAEPVMIDAQQNFRVEIEVPESDVLTFLRSLYGPLFIWVTLDGYMTRDVQ